MRSSKRQESWGYETLEDRKGALILLLTGRMDSANAGSMLRDLGPLLHSKAPNSLTVDLAEVTYVDDFGVLVLIQLRHMMTAQSGSFSLIHVTDRVREILSLLHFDDLTEKSPLRQESRSPTSLSVSGMRPFVTSMTCVTSPPSPDRFSLPFSMSAGIPGP